MMCKEIKSSPEVICRSILEDPQNAGLKAFLMKDRGQERRLAMINLLDSETVKKRIMEEAINSPYLPVLVAAKVTDKLAGTAFAPFYFCKYLLSAHNIFESYMEMIQSCAGNIATALKLIALADGPVLFHCTLGKDRTGLIAMFILYILGASESAILFDYNLTELAEPYFQEYNKRFIVKYSGLTEGFCSASVETMRNTLDYLSSEFGSIINYLDKIGFNENWREYLRHKYLESYNPQYRSIAQPQNLKN